MVPVVYSPEYLNYDFGPGHPFSPLRQKLLLAALEGLKIDLPWSTPTIASVEDVLTVHDPTYVERVQCAGRCPDALNYGLGTVDVPAFAGMDRAARSIAGGTLHAADLIIQGHATEVQQLGGGLHHAHRSMASGFCIYNDLALAIRRFRAAGMRVAYLDIDVHHGDGVQALFNEDPDVLVISLHESGHYLFPGSGGVHEMGTERGRGYKLNLPLEPLTWHDDYLRHFDAVVPHALSWFAPDVLVVVFGVDAHYQDPLADLLLTTESYRHLLEQIRGLGRDYAGGKALYTFAGGYDPDATLRSWLVITAALQGVELPSTFPPALLEELQTLAGCSISAGIPDTEQPTPRAGAASIAEQNARNARRLMETVVRYW